MPLEDRSCIKNFKCGVNEIDSWAKQKSYKFQSTDRARVFVAILEDGVTAIGFYTLTLSREDTSKLIENEHRDRYDKNGVPFVYIGHLAIQRSYQNQGLGSILLIDALRRTYEISKNVAFYGIALRSLNDSTTELYRKFGFGVAPNESSNPLMILSIWTLRDLINGNA